MKRLALILLLLLAASAAADIVRKGDTSTLTLTAADCAPEVLQLLKPEHHARFHAAIGVVNGKRTDVACWTLTNDGAAVYVKFASGGYGQFPLADFENDPGV